MEQPDHPTDAPEPEPTFDALYAQYWAPLVRLGHLLTGSQALGEELAQEAFLGSCTTETGSSKQGSTCGDL